MPGMGGMGGRRSRKPVDTQRLYDVLGVNKGDPPDVIRKAYRKLAVKNHPDKGGDEAKFKEIQKAFDILGDERKREVYDQAGEEGLEDGGGGGGPGDIFDVLSGRGRSRKPQGVKKGEAMVHPLKMTLEQVYKGSSRTLRLTRKVIDKERGVETCSACNGTGVRVQTIRMGPMIQQVQQACNACGGTGKIYRMQKVQETLEVHVPKGSPDQHRINFFEKGDEIPDGEAGDVTFVLQEQPHAVFKRKGDDLYIERTISLSEALCGFQMELKHLDDRTLIIKTAPGEIIRPVSYDPFAEDSRTDWTLFEDTDVPSLENAAVAETEEDEERAEQLIAQTEAVYKRKHCYRTEMFQLQDACIAEKDNVNEALIMHAALAIMQSTAARVGMFTKTRHDGACIRWKKENPLRVRDVVHKVQKLVLKNAQGVVAGEATSQMQLNWRRVKKQYFEVYLFRSALTANAVSCAHYLDVYEV